MRDNAESMGDPGTWETARELAKHLVIPVGPYTPRVPTPEEFNAVLPYILNRATTFYEPQYFCERAELALAHLLGMNVPRQGFPKADGYSRHGYDWEGYSRRGYDRDGYDREGYDADGYNRDGYNRENFDRYGFDRDGFNRTGCDRSGQTREAAIEELVRSWSDHYAAVIEAELLKRLPAPRNSPAPRAAARPRKVISRKTATPRGKVATPPKLAAV